jgi:dienelactone hydrolase
VPAARAIALIFLSFAYGAGAQTAGNPVAPQTGAYTITATSEEAVGADSAAAFAAIIPPDEIVEWQVVVPENYSAERPPGLLVYISPSDSGSLPRQWSGLPETHNLIWIAAERSGNRRSVARRIAYALFAAGLSSRHYKIDASRIYLSGFSGGARVAGLVAAAYPQLFRGNIYIGGAELWESEPAPAVLEAMRRNRYVFLVGTEDPNRDVARSVANKYEEAGIEGVRRMIISRLGHELPKQEDMEVSLDYLAGAAEP